MLNGGKTIFTEVFHRYKKPPAKTAVLVVLGSIVSEPLREWNIGPEMKDEIREVR